MRTAIQFREDSSKEEIQEHLGKASAHIRKAMECLTDTEYNERQDEDWDEDDSPRHIPPMYRGRMSRRGGRYM